MLGEAAKKVLLRKLDAQPEEDSHEQPNVERRRRGFRV